MIKQLLVCLAFAGAIGAAYYNALGNGFVFDDYLLVVDRGIIRSTQPLTDFLFAPLSLGYRPFRTFSYVIDARLGGMEPWVFHASNLFYHWVTTCFVFLVALRLTNVTSERSAALSLPNDAESWRWRPAIFITALWALHPIQTDAVTYISGRRDILGGLCLFVGLWAYGCFRSAEQRARVWRYGWLLLSCVVYGLGILSKESVVVLPVLCWFYDIQREGVVESLRRRWTLYFLVLLLGFAVLWHFAGPIFFLTIRDATWHGGSIAGNFATVARIWQHYLSLMVYPHTLLADYSYNAFPVSSSFTEPEVITALSVLAGVVISIGILARRWPLCKYGGLWMLVSILPVSHIIPIKEILAEHYLYVPLFGFCLIVGVVLDGLCGVSLSQGTLWSRVRAATVYGVVILLLAGAVARTIARNRDWADEQTFWTVVTQTAPQGARAHYNLAGTYKRQSRLDNAAQEFMRTLAISPQHVGAIVGLGELAFESGHYGQALGYATQAQKIAPQHPRVVYLLSWVKLALKKVDEAEELFQQAAILMPDYPGVYAGLEEVARARGDEAAATRWGDKRRALEADLGQTS